MVRWCGFSIRILFCMRFVLSIFKGIIVVLLVSGGVCKMVCFRLCNVWIRLGIIEEIGNLDMLFYWVSLSGCKVLIGWDIDCFC